jgi:hypothetical protein
MIVTFSIALGSVFAACSPLRADHCLRHVDKPVCTLPAPVCAGWNIADTLRFCKTYTGGECCTEMAKCSGNPLGCFCAFESVLARKMPSSNQSLAGRLAGY